jgi:hypothetical protein
MRAGVVVWLSGAVLLVGAAVAGARAHDLGDEELQVEMNTNRALGSYVARNGLPDVAESHFLSDQPPWDDHEVTVYYIGQRKEIGFARAWILGRPTIHVVRYERPLTDADIAALEPRIRHRHLGDPAERAEAAARRAEDAAGRVETAAAAADRAATRAEEIAGKMERSFHKSLRK